LCSAVSTGNVRLAMRVAVVAAVLLPALLTACLPPQLGGRPPSFDAFLRRNGLRFEQTEPAPPDRTAAAAAAAQQDGPGLEGAPVNPPIHGVLSCPVACRALLSKQGEAREFWFVSYTGTEYGVGDIAWALVDREGLWALSTSDNP